MMFKISTLFAAMLIIAACHTTKKNSSGSSVGATSSSSAQMKKGIYAPDTAELAAVLTKYPNATLPVLTEGYQLYVGSACTDCHGSKSIYKIPEKEWPRIIEVMGKKAKLNDTQKDALLNYVFSIKATQPIPVK